MECCLDLFLQSKIFLCLEGFFAYSFLKLGHGPSFTSLVTIYNGARGSKRISRVSREFWLVRAILQITRHSSLTRLGQTINAFTVSKKW